MLSGITTEDQLNRLTDDYEIYKPEYIADTFGDVGDIFAWKYK